MSSIPDQHCSRLEEPDSNPLSELFSFIDNRSWSDDEDDFVNEITCLHNQLDTDFIEHLIDEDEIVVEFTYNSDKLDNDSPTINHFINNDSLSYLEQGGTFASVYPEVTCFISDGETNSLATLTPPHSPKHVTLCTALETNIKKGICQNIEDQQLDAFKPSLNENVIPNETDQINSSCSEDSNPEIENDGAIEVYVADNIAQNVQIVDEIVNSRANEMFWDLPCDSSVDCDHEYASSSLSSSASSLASSEEQDSLGKIVKRGLKKRIGRPYARSNEDRKVRKKEQNKNAATRYRQKKKHEMETILNEEHELLAHNENLVRKFKNIQQEVKYLKRLIKEFNTPKS